MTTLKKQKIYFWTPEKNRLKLGMKKVSPTTDEIFIIRNVRNVYAKIDKRSCIRITRIFGEAKIGGVYVEVWKNPTSDSYWDIS